MKTLIRTLAIMASLFAAASAQQLKSDAPAAKPESEAVDAAAIFDEIIQTLPEALKADIDSASRHNETSGTQKPAAQEETGKHAAEMKSDARLEELPEEVRRRVEKAIEEIEKRGAQRSAQFKEIKKKHNAK